MKKSYAVLGAHGYLGAQIAFCLKCQGLGVAEFDLPDADVLSDKFWRHFCPSDYEAIFFFSGLTGTEASFAQANKFISVNEVAVLNLLNSVASLGEGAPMIVFPSSRLVYKGSETLLDEDSTKEARTVYAASKIAAEALLQAYHSRFGVPYAVVRICVPYGNVVSHDYSYGTIGVFMKQAMSGKITLYGDGSVRRTFTHVSDICNVVLRLGIDKVCGVFNIGGEHLSLLEVAQVVAHKMGGAVECVPWPKNAERIESGSTCFDSRKLDNIIGYKRYRKISDVW